MVDSVYWIWFQQIFGYGTRRAELFLNYFEHPQEIYDDAKSKGRAYNMLTQREQERIDFAFEQANIIKVRTIKKNCDIITPDSPKYPSLLQQIYSKPAVLYVKGDLSSLTNVSVGMVGTRTHTEYGKNAAEMIASDLAKSGVTIVSGLAKGIDTICHWAALDAGGKTIGILGCGLDIDYPNGSSKLKSLMSKNGAVVSEFPLGTSPKGMNFPIRNRIISGMCKGVVVIEADIASGSMITANHALDQSRDVFALPNSIFTNQSRGTHSLIKDGAKPVVCADDILEEYGLPLLNNIEDVKVCNKDNGISNKKIPNTTILELPLGLSEDAIAVLKILAKEPATVDNLAEYCNCEIANLHIVLTELEIYGLVESLPGRIYKKSNQ